jgi:hypothetical protein
MCSPWTEEAHVRRALATAMTMTAKKKTMMMMMMVLKVT